MAAGLKLSVIIPVGPGERDCGALLGDLAALEPGAEIILVAATGQMPGNVTAQDHGLHVPARWIEAPAGRASQQNAGAAAAAGEALWFLHADSRVPPASIAQARDFAGRAALGYFDLRFRDDGPRLARLNAAGAWIRSRWLGLPFGDQGLLLPRTLFQALGGFDETLQIGEDHALVWAARHAGVRLLPLRAPLYTSARRYAEQGWLRTTLRNARLTIAQSRQFSSGPSRRGADRP